MNLVDNLFEEFVNSQESSSSNDRIKWFKRYLITQGLNDSNYYEKLSNIKRSDVFASLDLFINNSRVKNKV